MTINDAKLTIQLISLPPKNTEDLAQSKVGDKFKIKEIRESIIKAIRLRDRREIIIFGDTGAKHFRICNDCKSKEQ